MLEPQYSPPSPIVASHASQSNSVSVVPSRCTTTRYSFRYGHSIAPYAREPSGRGVCGWWRPGVTNVWRTTPSSVSSSTVPAVPPSKVAQYEFWSSRSASPPQVTLGCMVIRRGAAWRAHTGRPCRSTIIAHQREPKSPPSGFIDNSTHGIAGSLPVSSTDTGRGSPGGTGPVWVVTPADVSSPARFSATTRHVVSASYGTPRISSSWVPAPSARSGLARSTPSTVNARWTVASVSWVHDTTTTLGNSGCSAPVTSDSVGGTPGVPGSPLWSPGGSAVWPGAMSSGGSLPSGTCPEPSVRQADHHQSMSPSGPGA